MSFQLLTPMKSVAEYSVSFNVDTRLILADDKKVNSTSGSAGKIQRGKICLHILDYFTIRPKGFSDTVHHVYRYSLIEPLNNYLGLIRTKFKRESIALDIFEDIESKYKSLFITIYISSSSKSYERKYNALINKIVKSDWYNPEIDIDYKLIP